MGTLCSKFRRYRTLGSAQLQFLPSPSFSSLFEKVEPREREESNAIEIPSLLLPQHTNNSTPNGFYFVAILLLCFSFSVNPQHFFNSQPYNYPTASAPASWTNSSSLQGNYSSHRDLLVRLNASHNMSFATGFYCFPPCKSFFLSIYIVYAYVHDHFESFQDPQVIWSANRAHPVGENATLQLTSQDGLTLCDSDGSLVWSTTVVNQSVAGINITEAGNLVLFDINNSTIWQSFDYPTDCLVMGQTLVGGMRIIASSSSTNLNESQFYLTLLADGLYGFVNSDPPLMYYYNMYGNYYHSNRTVDTSIFIKFMNGSLTIFSTSSNTDTNTNILEFPSAKSTQYMRLESDRHLRLYDYDDLQGWKMVGDLFNMDNCNYPTVCGHYGICNNGQCTCPTGILENYFKLVDNRRAELGCTPVTNITCQDVNNHRLLEIKNVTYFNNADNVAFNSTDEETCKRACLRDCKCKAALFQQTYENPSGRCLTLPEVFSLQNEDQFNSIAYIKVQVAPSTPSTPPPPSSSKVGLGLILGSTFGALLFMLTLISIYIVCLRRREEAQDEDIIEQLPGMPTRFTLKELQAATENFVKELGKGGFGTVFEGRWGDERIAVKRLDSVGHGKNDFLTEVETIGSIHHINLVRLIGFCVDKSNRFLVYEYMCNGSLDRWIYCRDGRVPLDWSARFKIITDIAKGLCYLHEECRQKIVHFDIKPANILLDENFNAKVSDFGLSKLIDRDISIVMTKMRGTIGYLAPEWLTSMVTEKVDVYSFGVVVMEILCGRRNIDDSKIEENRHLIKLLEEKSKSNELSDLIDKNLRDVELYKKEIVNVMELAMWCLQWDSIQRPSMLIVVKVLEGGMEVETSLDYNFVSSIPMIANIPRIVEQSAPLPTSVLSGPR